MADVVNLRTVRKQRRRAEARGDVGSANSPASVPTAEVTRRRAEGELERRRHEGHRLPPENNESEGS